MWFFALVLALVFVPCARSVRFTDDQCDISVKGAVCLFGGRRVLLPDAVPKSLIGHWTFDDMAVTDSSGNKNHADNAIPSGPGLWGRGASAYFNGFDFVQIPHSPTFTQAGGEYSVSLWLYLLNNPLKAGDANGRWCPLLSKGPNGGAGSPALMLQTQSRKFRFDSRHSAGTADEAESTAKLPMERWMHIAMVRSDTNIQLYVNGLLDKAENTQGHTGVMSEEPLYLGSVDRDNCNVQIYMDEVRFYGRAITKQEIQAEASPALGGIPPSFAQLGCLSCDLAAAQAACPASMHLCTEMELHSGAYQVAIIMGYANWETALWNHADVAAGGAGSKLAMCCTNSM